MYHCIKGISRDHWHKRRPTGGKRKPIRKKRKFELGRPAANTKLGPQRIHTVSLQSILYSKYVNGEINKLMSYTSTVTEILMVANK